MNEIYTPHPLIDKIEKLLQQKDMKIALADFKKEEIVIKINDCKDMLQKLKFMDFIDHVEIISANFETNTITIAISDVTKHGLTSKEIEFLKNGKKIFAIKEVRTRKGCGLKEAKDLVEQYEREHF